LERFDAPTCAAVDEVKRLLAIIGVQVCPVCN